MARNEFMVVLDGMELSPETVDAIKISIQKAVLTQIAGIDLQGDFAARIGHGGTQGIQVVAMTPEQVERAGLQLGQ
jgi:hypothetical protein